MSTPLGLDLPTRQKGQIRAVELRHAAVVKLDIEFVALHVEAKFHDPLAAPQFDVSAEPPSGMFT